MTLSEIRTSSQSSRGRHSADECHKKRKTDRKLEKLNSEKVQSGSTVRSIGGTSEIDEGLLFNCFWGSLLSTSKPYDVWLVTDHGRLQSDSHRIKHRCLRKKSGIDPLKGSPIKNLTLGTASAILNYTLQPVLLCRSSLWNQNNIWIWIIDNYKA